MIRCQIPKGILVCMIVLVSTAVSASPSFSAEGGKSRIPQLVIIEVRIDFVAKTMSIHGQNFTNGDAPAVTLGNQTLTVTRYTDAEIVAGLPAGFTDGGYLLTVSTGTANENYDVYHTTIRANGGDSGC